MCGGRCQGSARGRLHPPVGTPGIRARGADGTGTSGVLGSRTPGTVPCRPGSGHPGVPRRPRRRPVDHTRTSPKTARAALLQGPGASVRAMGGRRVLPLALGHAAAPRDGPDREPALPGRQRLRMDGGRADVLRRARPLRRRDAEHPVRRSSTPPRATAAARPSGSSVPGWPTAGPATASSSRRRPPRWRRTTRCRAARSWRRRTGRWRTCAPTGSTSTTPTTTTRRRRWRRPCGRSTSSCGRGRCATSRRRTTRRRGCGRPGRSPTGSGSPGTWPCSRTTT